MSKFIILIFIFASSISFASSVNCTAELMNGKDGVDLTEAIITVSTNSEGVDVVSAEIGGKVIVENQKVDKGVVSAEAAKIFPQQVREWLDAEATPEQIAIYGSKFGAKVDKILSGVTSAESIDSFNWDSLTGVQLTAHYDKSNELIAIDVMLGDNGTKYDGFCK